MKQPAEYIADRNEFARRRSLPGVRVEHASTKRTTDVYLYLDGRVIGQKTEITKRGRVVSIDFVLPALDDRFRAPRAGRCIVNVPDLVQRLADDVRDGANLDQSIDSYINTATFEEHTEILDELGDVDLSEPRPDLSAGWTRIRGQLAYNALFAAVSRDLAGGVQ